MHVSIVRWFMTLSVSLHLLSSPVEGTPILTSPTLSSPLLSSPTPDSSGDLLLTTLQGEGARLTKVSADHVQWSAIKKTLTLRGDIKIEQGAWAISSQHLTLRLNDKNTPLNFTATGGVHFQGRGLIARAAQISYQKKDAKITFSGGFQARWRGQHIQGQSGTLWMDSERVELNQVQGSISLPMLPILLPFSESSPKN
jgi:lipopolysaccharide transport protein LptA